MDEKNKVVVIGSIITALGVIGAALISNFDKIFPQNKPIPSPVHVVSSDMHQKSNSSVSTPKYEITTSTVPAQSEESKDVEKTDSSTTVKGDANDIHPTTHDNSSVEINNDFNKSDFLFENKKFIEDRPELFSNGRVSLTVRNSSDYECTVRISQFFKGKGEKEYELIKGSPFEVSVGGANYILHFTDGVYREYCIISSYAAF